MLFAVAFLAAVSNGAYVFYDDFESSTVDAAVSGQSPVVGQTWLFAGIAPSGPPAEQVQDEIAMGNQSAKLYRDYPPTLGGVRAQGALGQTVQAGQTITYEYFYRRESASEGINTSMKLGAANSTTIATVYGWQYASPVTYRVKNIVTGAVIDTGVAVSVGAWDKIDIVANIVDGGYAGVVTGTFDFYVNDILALAGTPIPYLSAGAEPAMDLFCGANGNTAYYDNVSIDIVPEPATISLLTLGLFVIRKKR